MKVTRNRDEVINECVHHVIGCWNYYSDVLLPRNDEFIERLKLAIAGNLPIAFSSKGWNKRAEEKQTYYESESTDE
jgi:hypothetical protein